MCVCPGVWRVLTPCLDIVSSRDHDKCQIVKLQPEPVIKVQRVRFTEQQSCLLNLLKYQRQRMDIERYWRGILTEDFLFIRPNKGSDGSFLKLTLYSMGYQPAS